MFVVFSFVLLYFLHLQPFQHKNENSMIFEAILAPFRLYFCPSWPFLCPSWPFLGPSWPILDHLGPSWPLLGPFFGHLGPILALSWPILAHLGLFLTTSWPILAPSLAILAPSWHIFRFFFDFCRFWSLQMACWTPGAPSPPPRTPPHIELTLFTYCATPFAASRSFRYLD